ncbi:MAG: LTA synthase family protein [Lachnospiraceae bacterium]|nr:LTA synthase family protein [Lachnospiraceae bacterium]
MKNNNLQFRNNKLLRLIYVSCSILAVCVFITPVNISQIAIYMVCGLLLSVLIFIFYDRLQWGQSIQKKYIPIALIIILFLGHDFHFRWKASSMIAAIAGKLGLSSSSFLLIVSIVLGFMAVGTINWIISKIEYCLRTIFRGRIESDNCFYIIIVVMMQYLSLQFSAIQTSDYILHQNMRIVIVNMLIIFLINLITVLVLQKWKLSLCITSIFFCVWSIANYYVILFHGSPLYISELVNMKTAAAVMSTYKYNISVEVIVAVMILLAEIYYIIRHISDKNTISWRKAFNKRAIGLGISIVINCMTLPSAVNNIQRWMPWSNIIASNGFMVTVIEDYIVSMDPILEPEGYDVAKLVDKKTNKENRDEALPDIIMILNETFCDPAVYTSITTDVNYMEDFYSIEGARYGYVITPDTGGGTNNSEFELLFSKSMKGLGITAPFTSLNSLLLGRNVVTYLEDLGYTTIGMHCGDANNYSRNTAYPAVGFDNIYLGSDIFSNLSYNGNRPWTDEDNYKDLIKHYESLKGNPQFIYLLTFQNHGGYEQNDASMDSVHVNEDFGDLTDDLNEYLSSIKLTGDAFKKLTDYYETVDRDVIICMVGDHAPSFITSLESKSDSVIADNGINARMVPYVIWSNYDVECSSYLDYASMVDLIPIVLDAADVPLSAFYENILELHELYPIRTREGQCVDKNLQISSYDVNDEKYEVLKQYYYQEYNSLLMTDEYKEELFLP